MTNVSDLYAPLIERDVASIPAAVRRFRETATSDELFSAVTRFAVLAYAPSQHAKHALLACVAAHELRDDFGVRWDDVLTECAIYAASSRQPWSEPPIGDPPAIETEQPRDVDELLAAVATGDRLRGERWLAARLHDSELAHDYFATALADAEDLGHKLIVGLAAWQLAALFPPVARFASLRIAIWEYVSYRGEPLDQQGVALDARTLLQRLATTLVAERGSMVAAHALFFFDAAVSAAEIARDPDIERRVREHLTSCTNDVAGELPELATAPSEPPVYRLARDCGATLKMYAVAKRLLRRFPDFDPQPLLAAAQHNLQHGTSFEEFSFA